MGLQNHQLHDGFENSWQDILECVFDKSGKTYFLIWPCIISKIKNWVASLSTKNMAQLYINTKIHIHTYFCLSTFWKPAISPSGRALLRYFLFSFHRFFFEGTLANVHSYMHKITQNCCQSVFTNIIRKQAVPEVEDVTYT